MAALAIAIVGVLRHHSHGSFKPKAGIATEASAGDLRDFSSSKRPVYWIGPQQDGKLELTRTRSGSIFVRYLRPGAAIGDPTAKYTTVGTYRVRNAYPTLRRTARSPETVSFAAPRGATALWRRSKPTSVYLAWPRLNYLVEIYDPDPARARSLARRGKVARIS
jgi:hypothetical protein